MVGVTEATAAAVVVCRPSGSTAAAAAAAASVYLPRGCPSTSTPSTRVFFAPHTIFLLPTQDNELFQPWGRRAGAVSGCRPPSPFKRGTTLSLPPPRPPAPSESTPDSFFALSWSFGGADPTWLPRSAEAHQLGLLPPGDLLKRYACGHGQPAGTSLGGQIRSGTPHGNPPGPHLQSIPPLPPHTSPAFPPEAKHAMLCQGPPHPI